jgi:hypothetical protein
MKTLKLFRGLKSKDFIDFNQYDITEYYKDFDEILQKRADGDLSYPHHLDSTILSLKKREKFLFQQFSDDPQVASTYQSGEGCLVTVDVPLADIKKYFIVNFQNFPNRKEKFELVYLVKMDDLVEFRGKWMLEILRT